MRVLFDEDCRDVFRERYCGDRRNMVDSLQGSGAYARGAAKADFLIHTHGRPRLAAVRRIPSSLQDRQVM
ncbi:uncharacterized protein B0H18DRAFT_31113 [Fomitopsis serialis]|uniref:uncharacterized protein n=1 Tax=Fomitopsis serialis TaxID=139415 RepID=UPI002007AFAB|nr:uncharacterized protein B0H18DRAFT_31113 [Neoantrodia serialis]KAH9932589.1 hypothetical protein B0H18DRAFT_31113 [Neoantrodia serialis]